MAGKKLSTILKASMGGMLCLSFLFVSTSPLTANAANNRNFFNNQQNQMMGQASLNQQRMQNQFNGQFNQGNQNQLPGQNQLNQLPEDEALSEEELENLEELEKNDMFSNLDLADSPSDIVTGVTSNSAMSLSADTSNATTYTMTDEDNSVKIDTAGTYIVTGSCSEGNIVVKKNTTGVVLILKDLSLTSSSGAPVSCNKYSETQIIIEGTVSLTDAENPSDETSSDADVADAFDGAALKIKDGASAYITGSGTLNINAASCKNGIKVGNDDAPSLVIDSISLNISAANDAINSGYDLAILSGSVKISASDDAIHADRVVTIGDSGNGPSINITSSCEGIEGTVVNLFGGNTNVTASDDGVNAANSDGTYESLGYSINITGGTHTINCSGDGLDSNGNINITGGYTTIHSGTTGGEAGIDYTGSCYIAEGTLSNDCGIASDAGMMTGQMGENGQNQMEGASGLNQNGGQFNQITGQPNQNQQIMTQPGQNQIKRL